MRISDASLFDEFEFGGLWWLPEKPEKKVRGTLLFKGGDRIRLELSGSLRDEGPRIVVDEFSPEFIHGLSEDGRDCTLADTIQVGQGGLLFPEVSSSAFVAHRLYIGKHFRSKEEIRFSSVSARLTYLEEWLGVNPFQIEFEIAGPTRITLPYHSREVFRARLPDRKVVVSLHSSLGFGSERTSNLNCCHRAYLRFEPDEWESEEWYDGLRRDCENLLTLFVGEPVYPTHVRGYGEEIESAPGRKRREEVLIYGSLLDPRYKESIHIGHMPVPFRLVENDIGRVLEAWCSKAEGLGPVYSLLSGAFYNRKTYVESEFLSLVQALETFHRRELGGKYLPGWEYEKHYCRFVESLPSDMPCSLRERLKEYLKYGNEYSLRKRLSELCEKLNKSTWEKIAGGEKDFIERVVSTRHYLTHYEEHLREKIFDGVDTQFRVNEKLRVMLTILLLKTIGLQEDDIAPGILHSLRA